MFDSSCQQTNEVVADFTQGATVSLIDGGPAQQQLGRVMNTEHLRSPHWDYGGSSCAAAAAQL